MPDGTRGTAMPNDLVLGLEIAGVDQLSIVSARITEGLSERTIAEVVVLSHEDLELARALHQTARLSIDGRAQREWTLTLVAADFIERKDSAHRHLLRLTDPLAPLAFTRDTRKFRNMSATAIVAKVLGEHGIAHRFELGRPTADRNYTVQYRESDLEFIERLMEFEGIYYSFQPDGTVVFADTSIAALAARPGKIHDLIEAAEGLSSGDVGIHALELGERVATGRVTLGDYDWKRCSVVSESGWGDKDTHLERYQFPAGFRQSDEGVLLSKMRAEAYRVGASFLDGRGNDPAFRPGTTIDVDGAAAASFAGEYLLVRMTHEASVGVFSEGQSVDGAGKYENTFSSIPKDRPFRPFPKTPRPTVCGSHTAIVRGPAGEEIHTDSFGRFKAQMHWDREALGNDEDSRWMRLLQESSSSMVLARTGWEVYVSYIDGDPDRPVGVARAINGQMVPVYAQPANKNVMAIQTPSSPATGGYNEIKIDDTAGAQHISIQAEKNFDAVIKHNKSETIGRHETHEVVNDFKRTVDGNQTIQIGANDKETFKSTSELKFASNRAVTVGASESVHVKATKKVSVTKSESEKVGAVRLSVVGSLKMPDFKAMAKSALQGLIPKNPFEGLIGAVKQGNPLKGLVASLESKVKDEVKGLPDELLKAAKDGAKEAAQKDAQAIFDKMKASYAKDKSVEGALKAGVAAIDPKAELEDAAKGAEKSVEAAVEKAITDLKDAPKDVVSKYVADLLPQLGGYDGSQKFEGAGGFLPSLDQLSKWYSVDAITKGLEDQIKGLVSPDKLGDVLSQATGGLSDIFVKHEKGQNLQLQFKLGWDEADKIIDMFTTGGIKRQAEKSFKRIVGGAQVQAAVGPISWGAKYLWAETIGVAKLTKSPVTVEQGVKGKMNLTVLGAVVRHAGVEIVIKADASTVDAGQKATYDSKKELGIISSGSIKITGSDEALVKAIASMKLGKGAAVLDCKKLGIEAKNLILVGNVLNAGKD